MTLNEREERRSIYPLEPRDPNCVVPLSPIQLAVWNWRQRHGDLMEVRRSTTAFRVLGLLNIQYLRDSIEIVVNRHESLRTRFVVIDGEPAQKIDPIRNLQIEIVDLSCAVKGSVESVAYETATAFLHQPVHLSVGPLFEAKLLSLSTHEHILILAISHMVTDGGSIRILVEEIWSLYFSAIYNQNLSLPALPIQYADYALWQKRNYETWKARHETYWRKHLSGTPRFTPATPNRDGSSCKWMTWSFGPELRNRLYTLAQQRRTLLSMTMLTVYVATLSHWCAQTDLVLALISHGRYRHELQGMVGWIATGLYLRINVDANDTYASLLDKVSVEFRASTSHHDHGHMLNLLTEFPKSFTFNWKREPFHVCPTDPRGGLIIQPYSIERHLAMGGFLPFFHDNRTSIDVTVNFDSDVFKADTFQQFFESMHILAEGFVQNPDDRLRTLPGEPGKLFLTP